MKNLALLLLLTGCGYGYEVKEHRYASCPGDKVLWKCEETKPIFFFNNIIQVCDSREECNKICLELRKENK